MLTGGKVLLPPLLDTSPVDRGPSSLSMKFACSKVVYHQCVKHIVKDLICDNTYSSTPTTPSGKTTSTSSKPAKISSIFLITPRSSPTKLGQCSTKSN